MSGPPSIPSKGQPFTRVSSLLRYHAEDIVQDWQGRVAEAVASHSVEPEALENSIRVFLSQLARQLEQGVDEDPSSAAEHGEQRFRIGYHLAAMTKEYGLLLQSIERAAHARDVDLTMAEFGALSRLVVAGISEAATAYLQEQRRAQAQQASQHFAFMAHELRTPLQTMRMALDAWDAGIAEDRVQRMLDRSVERMGELLDQSLIGAKADADGAPLDPRCGDFDLAEMLADILESAEVHARANEVVISVAVPAEGIPVHLDPRLVRSILTNLVRNGIKFSRRGGTVVARARLADDDQVIIEVEDSCGGLPKGAAEQMFTPFTQLSEDRSGFGLGLAITREAAEAHRGRIQVHDVAGEGCVFVVNLPRRYVPK